MLPDAAAVVEEAVREQYDRLFAAMTAPDLGHPGQRRRRRAVARVRAGPGCASPTGRSSRSAGCASGSSAARRCRRARPPGRGRRVDARTCVPEDGVRRRRRAGCDPVDVLCSHVPPAVPELAYDVVTRRAEASSAALLRRGSRRDRPRAALFGHVHQPLARAGAGRAAPSASTSATSAAPACPYVLRW